MIFFLDNWCIGKLIVMMEVKLGLMLKVLIWDCCIFIIEFNMVIIENCCFRDIVVNMLGLNLLIIGMLIIFLVFFIL